MRDSSLSLVAIAVDENADPLTLSELCRACRVSPQDVAAWVDEAIVAPEGARPNEWRFDAAALRRALVAARLSRELEVASHDLGLVLDLLDEIGRLQAQLRRAGVV
jgi:chaperone modulatory protein CbpM